MTAQKDNGVLIVGSVALDSVETPAGFVERALGGAATYSSVSASFFAPVMLVGIVGQDFPKEHIDFLKSRSIDIRGLEIADGETFHWKGSYEGDMNQALTIATELNVFQTFSPELPEDYKKVKYVFLANIDPEIQLKVLDQIEAPTLVACDTMNFWIETKRDALLEVIKRVNVVFINDAEARQLMKTFNLNKAATAIRQLGPRYVIIKKGEHGAAMYCDQSTCFAAASYPLDEVVDPTGAGDSFAGGFMGFISQQKDIDESSIRKAVVVGSTMASFNVQDFSLNMFKKINIEDINARYNEFRKMAHFDAMS
ncbi:MAG: PfkB family carbohydrate kinase [Armatimonadota bacterium]